MDFTAGFEYSIDSATFRVIFIGSNIPAIYILFLPILCLLINYLGTGRQCILEMKAAGYNSSKSTFNDLSQLIIYRSSKLRESNDVFVLSDGHSEDNPILERVICPSLHHPTFAALVKSPKLLDIVQDLVGIPSLFL